MVIPLVHTKTYLPSPRAGWVHRPRLLETLNRCLQNGQRLVLLSSAAGSGKSSLISDWARQAPAALAWLALDEQDNDPALFWAYCIAAIQRHAPGFCAALQSQLLSPQPPQVDLVLPDLLNQIAGLAQPLVLVLDDYHWIEQASIHSGVVFLIEHAPPNFTLVLSTRVDPPMPLSRWRARGDLVEIRAGELRFQGSEAADYLTRFMGLRLDEDDIALLEARTEGWAAGLQLAALSMQGKPDPKAFISKFSASHQYILDYLTSEVLSQQPAEIQNFLIQTSILSQLQASLCDALLEIQDSAGILESLYRRNLFVVSLDDERTWYRYHHLFAELLRIRFARLDKAQAAAIHLRAARWHADQGSVDEAIRHALAAGDAALAGQVVQHHWREAVQEGRLRTAMRWFHALPGDVVRADPLLCNAWGWVLAMTGNTGEAAQYAGLAGRQVAEMKAAGTLPAQDPEFERLAGQLPALQSVIGVRAGNADQASAFALEAIQKARPDDFFASGTAYMTLAAAYRQQGRIEESIEALENSLGRIQAIRQTVTANISILHLGRLLVVQGRLRQASQLFESALSEEQDPDHNPAAGALLAGLSSIRYEQNRLEEAEALLSRIQDLSRRGGSHDVRKYALLVQAQIAQARQDLPGALAMADELVSLSRQDPLFLQPAQGFQAWLQARSQQAEPARQWAEATAPDWTGHPGVARMAVLLYRVRVLLALGEAAGALAELAALGGAAQASASLGWQIEIGLLRALALAQQGQSQPAAAALSDSLSLAEPEGFTRLYLDEGEPVRQLLVDLLSQIPQESQRGTVRRLLASFAPPSGSPAGSVRGAQAGLPEPLSPRELEVLQLIAEGLPNQEIAARLVISLATVKTHVIHIFAKMGVQNRVEATNLAKELHLI